MLYLYKDDTLIKVEPNGLLFISLMPLRQESRISFQKNEKEYLEELKAQREQLIRRLEGFVGDRFRKKGTGGAIYKLISYFQRYTPIQEYLLKKEDISKFLEIERKTDLFDFLRKRELIEMDNFYYRKDFLVINTYFTRERLIKDKLISKKEPFYTYFTDIKDFKHYRDIKNKFYILYNSHYQNYYILDDFRDNLTQLNKSNIYEWLSRLALKEEFSDIKDFNFISNNTNIGAKNNSTIHTVIQKEGEDNLIYIEEKPNYLEIFNYLDGSYKYEFITENEEIIVENDDENKHVIYYALDKTLKSKRILFEASYESIKNEFSTREIKGAIVTKPPSDFSNESINKIIENSIKTIKPEEFIIVNEFIKINKETYETLLKSKANIYGVINDIPSLGGLIYKKDDIKDVLRAIKSAMLYKDEVDFVKTRIYFAIKKKRFKSYELPSIQSSLNAKNITGVLEAKLSMKNFFYPFFYIPNLKLDTIYSYELTDKQCANLFDNRYANVDFCGKNYDAEHDLRQVVESPFFVYDEDFIYGIDIFSGVDKYNMLIVGASGSGKSFTANIILNGLLNRYKENILIDIIDSGHSFERFLKIREGLDAVINKSSKRNCLNPFIATNYVAMLFFLEKMSNLYILSKEDVEFAEFFKKDNNYFYIKKALEYLQYNQDFKIASTYEEAEKIDEEKYDYVIWNEKDKIFETNFAYTSIHELHTIYHSILILMFGAKKRGESPFDLYAEQVSSRLADIIYMLFSDEAKRAINKIEANKTKENIIKVLDGRAIFTPLEAKELLEKLIINLKMPEEIKQSFLVHADEYISFAKSGNLFNCKPREEKFYQVTGIELGEGTDEKIKGVLISSIIMKYFSKMTSVQHRSKRKVLFIDEAHKIINDKIALMAIAYLYRTTRKHGACVTLLSQSISDFFKIPEEVDKELITHYDAISQNSGWIWVLGKGHKVSDLKKLYMPDDIINFFSQTPKKGEKKDYKFFLKSDIAKNIVKLVASDFDYWSATSHAEEKALIKSFNLFINDLFYTTFILSYVLGKSFIKKYNDSLENFILEMGARKASSLDEKAYKSELIKEINILAKRLNPLKFFNFPLNIQDVKTSKEAEIIYAMLLYMNKQGMKFVPHPKRKE